MPFSRLPPNYLSGQHLKRSSQVRKDALWLERTLASPGTTLVPIWRTRNLVVRTATHTRAQLPPLDAFGPLDPQELILLGEFQGRATFAYELSAERAPAAELERDFHELRSLLEALPEDEAALLAYARALILWRERHRHCGRCGSSTLAANAGHVRRCTNPHCGLEQFPRIDPAIIVLVTDGERALLGRQATWPPGRYSTIAGFVEPGESLEDAVAREVLEETGVRVDEVTYQSSQPWPFPSSLMLGFSARAITTNIVRWDEELEDAQWFTRAQIAAGDISLPPAHSISFRLIAEWYDAGAQRRLREEK